MRCIRYKLTYSSYGIYIIGFYLIIAGISKLLNPDIVLEAIIKHDIIPPIFQEPIIFIHALVSIILGCLLVSSFAQWRYYLLILSVAFIGLSILYIFTVIIRNGWTGDCGCFPGLYRSNYLYVPVFIDLFLLGYSLFCLIREKRQFRVYARRKKENKMKKFAPIFPCVAILVMNTAGHYQQQEVIKGIDDTVGAYEIMYSVPGHSFFHPISLSVDSPYVFVADQGDDNITVLNWDLSFSHYIGHRGQGPGEFGRLNDIDVRNNIVVAHSLEPPRISLFNISGEFIGDFGIDMSYWGDIAFSANGNIFFVHYNHSSPYLITEYSLTGDIVSEYFNKPELVNNVSEEAYARLRNDGEQYYLIFHWRPRICGFGKESFDWTYNYRVFNPFIDRYWDSRETYIRTHPGSDVLPLFRHNGGFDYYGKYLFIAGPVFSFIVLDTKTGNLYPLDLGEPSDHRRLNHILISNSRQIQILSDVRVKGDDILAISYDGACLIIMKVSNILKAAENATAIQPETKE